MEVREPSARYLVGPMRKQTEAGSIPHDWAACEVAHAFEICNQRRMPLSRTTRSGMSGPYPYYGPTGPQDWINDFRFDGEYVLIGEDGDHFLKWRTQSMTLLVRGRFNVNNHAHALRAVADNHTDWFRWFFANRDITQYLTRQGASRYKLTKATLARLPCALPSPKEQRAISGSLTDADTLINSLEQLLTKKRQIKQGAMQELLTGKRRLRDQCEWHWLSLGEAATLKARIGWQGLTTAEYRERGEHLLVTGTEFLAGRIDWDSCHYVDQDRYVQDKNIQLVLGDVLVTKDGTIGKAALIESLPMPATLNSGVFVIRPRNQAFHPGFFYYLLASSVFASFLGQLSAGSTINHLYQKDFVHFKFRAPQDIEEQRAVFEVVRAIDSEIEIIDARLTKARALKQAMAQALLTGRIRLVEPVA